MRDQSPRQELREFAERGDLRQAIHSRLSIEATDLAVDVIRRYCESRPSRRRQEALRA